MATGHSVEAQEFLTEEPVDLSSYAPTHVAPNAGERVHRRRAAQEQHGGHLSNHDTGSITRVQANTILNRKRKPNTAERHCKMCMCVYLYIYIYIYIERERDSYLFIYLFQAMPRRSR